MTHAVGAPRVAGIEHPFGLQLGAPGDRATQLAVLRGTLQALSEMRSSGEVVELPFRWAFSDEETNASPPVPLPITQYLKKHPMQVMKLIRRDIPEYD